MDIMHQKFKKDYKRKIYTYTMIMFTAQFFKKSQKS